MLLTFSDDELFKCFVIFIPSDGMFIHLLFEMLNIYKLIGTE